MVLIDMRDSQRLRRQDDLGVVVEVELEQVSDKLALIARMLQT